ncbi:MAG: hypothetical protein K0R39_5042, partial [Symbiobacteriaceae bacterium]|nr:hypothetical protein [Symbiobacteriaceae bacterium]
MRRMMAAMALAVLLGGCAAGKVPDQGVIIDPSPAVDCGTEQLGHGATGVNEEARKCLLA